MNLKRLFFLAVLASCLVASSCSYLKKNPAPRKFTIERIWAKHTLLTDYVGYRVNHRMTPLLYKDLIIQGNGVDGVSAYKVKTGRLKWSREIEGGVEIGAALYGNTIYFGANDGFFYALNADNGQTKWVFPIRTEGLGAPVVHEGVVYFLTANNIAYALDASSGEQRWLHSRRDTQPLTIRGASRPVVYQNNLIVGFSDGSVLALNMERGTVVWERQLSFSQRFRDVDSGPVLDGEFIYVATYDDRLFKLNASSGEVVWSYHEGGFTDPLVYENNVYYTSSTGKIISLEKETGALVWEKDLKTGVASSPVYFRGLLLFGEWDGQLRAVNALNGESVSSFTTGRGVVSTPKVDEDSARAYVMTKDGNLFSFRLRWQATTEVWPWEK